MILQGRRYDNGELVEVHVSDGVIASVEPARPSRRAELAADFVAPAFVDIQVNGYGGQSFSSTDLTAEKVAAVLEMQPRFGAARLCPTLITDSFEAIAAGCRAIREACEADRLIEHMVAGIHLEGPYLAPEDGPRGAHPLRHIRPADWAEFQRWQEASGGRVRLVTLAPERPGALDFIRKLAAAGVVVAIGHTAASPQEIRAAIDAGARLSTHIGNASHPMLPRHENYLWEQLAADELWASIICDGHHLPPAVLRCVVRCKTPQRLIVISDASPLAGLPPGRYEMPGGAVEILSSGKIVMSPLGNLAGSAQGIDAGVSGVMRFAGVSLQTAVDMATLRPAELLGVARPSLSRGSRADLVLFDHRPPDGALAMRATLIGGQVQYRG